MKTIINIFLIGLLLSTILQAFYDALIKVHKLSPTIDKVFNIVVYIPFLIGFYCLLGTILHILLVDKIQFEILSFELFIVLLVGIIVVVELIFFIKDYDIEDDGRILFVISLFIFGFIILNYGGVSVYKIVYSVITIFVIFSFFGSETIEDSIEYMDFYNFSFSSGIIIFCISVGGIFSIIVFDHFFYNIKNYEFFESLIHGIFAGLFVGFVFGGILLIAFITIIPIYFGILNIISSFIHKPLYKILLPIIIKLIHQNVLCDNCLHISKPLKSNYEYGERYCEHCGSSSFLKNVKCVIGLIGSNIEVYQLEGDKFYINLWDKENEIARNADINILEIRNTKSIKNYDFVINSVYTTLYNDVSRDKNYLKGVSVIIKGNPRISEDVLNMLKKNFKEVSYA
jgi:hypothetical protein